MLLRQPLLKGARFAISLFARWLIIAFCLLFAVNLPARLSRLAAAAPGIIGRLMRLLI